MGDSLVSTTLQFHYNSRMDKIAAKRVSTSVTLDGVLRALRAELPELERSYEVRSLGVFGSIVRGDRRPGSDVDILVDFGRPPTFFQFVELEDRLTEVLGAKADLVMRTALKPRIGERILAEVIDV
jgi:predicted nucleotidyltransferase